jgi:adenosylmethionine-8-amino-7-oxononanoate aminotransferase
LKSLVEKNNVGAFIFEPLVQGAAGMRIYDHSILDQMIAYAQRHGVVCIADEVFTGFGRTGKIFATDFLAHKPDIISMSKGITGGTLPLGVTSCSRQIVSAFRTNDFLKTFFHGHSYTANPLCCAAANASFELLQRSECQEAIQRISLQQQDFASRLQGHPKLTSAKSQGTILALEIKAEGEAGYTNEARKRIYNYFLGKNILLRPLGNVIYVLPPYVILPNELDLIHNTIIEFLDAYK